MLPATPPAQVVPAHPHARPPYRGGTVRPVIVIDPAPYLAPAAPVAAAAHPTPPPKKKTASGEDVFETHSTENR